MSSQGFEWDRIEAGQSATVACPGKICNFNLSKEITNSTAFMLRNTKFI